MGTTLATLAPPRGAKKNRKRLGRGPGSGLGVTAGKGEKGQKARAGGFIRVGFEGGQMPLQRRLPKRGFKNPFRVQYSPVNLGDLASRFRAGELVDAETLKARGLVPRRALQIKILANGELSHALVVRVQAFSSAAAERIAAAGGSAEVVSAAKRARSTADA
jgi:large subunit ribosomal protein L15